MIHASLPTMLGVNRYGEIIGSLAHLAPGWWFNSDNLQDENITQQWFSRVIVVRYVLTERQ